MTCVSRPRRFGKSYAAKMLAAYYDCSCNSHDLFDDKEIAEDTSYAIHMNKYNVISLDIAGFISDAQTSGRPLREIPEMIKEALRRNLTESGFKQHDGDSLNDFLIRAVEQSGGKPFVFIIDEWDAMIREAVRDAEAQKLYLKLLRGWFKNNNFTPVVVAAAYMTGILPIKKDGTQSAISDFNEYTFLDPGGLATYTGFLEQEVRQRCDDVGMDFGVIKDWYDGYDFPRIGAVYNPYSVMKALANKKCRSYWKRTSTAESLKGYINMDFDGLQDKIARLIAEERIEVDTEDFQNDFESFESADDVLTLLIHLGYLAYDEDEGSVYIPNEEVRIEFERFLGKKQTNAKWMSIIRRSQRLLDATINKDGETVSALLQEIREEQYAPQYYNDEQALRAVIKYAYIVTYGQYLKVEEMPSGRGIADVVFIPKPMTPLPALVVELKWNKSSKKALSQIESRGYASVIKDFGGEILLVAINYDEKTNRHTCLIAEG